MGASLDTVRSGSLELASLRLLFEKSTGPAWPSMNRSNQILRIDMQASTLHFVSTKSWSLSSTKAGAAGKLGALGVRKMFFVAFKV